MKSHRKNKPVTRCNRVSEESILEIVKDDIIRIAGESGEEKVPLDLVKSQIRASNSFISEAVRELKIKGLIEVEDDSFRLTKRGREAARDIIEKHCVIEDYFEENRSKGEAHKAADIMEHCVSVAVLNKIKKLSTFEEEGFPLTELGINQENLIIDIRLPDTGLLERVVSMGLLPGEKVKIVNRIPEGLIVKVKSKKFAVGEDIARSIKVSE